MDYKTLLVTGPRDYADSARVDLELTEMYMWAGPLIVIHGEAPGLDTLAKEWARAHPYCIEAGYKADWSKGKGAGPQRNQLMVNLDPDIVLAFLVVCEREGCEDKDMHYTHGTSDCVERAKKARLHIEFVYH